METVLSYLTLPWFVANILHTLGGQISSGCISFIMAMGLQKQQKVIEKLIINYSFFLNIAAAEN